MKITLNWHVFNLSNNYILSKVIDNCIILHDDKQAALINLIYYPNLSLSVEKDFHLENDKIINDYYIENIFDKEIFSALSKKLNFKQYFISPLPKISIEDNIYNIGVFILSGFSFKTSTLANLNKDFISKTIMTKLYKGITVLSNDLKALKETYYPELKSTVDNSVYLKQEGFQFNLFLSIFNTIKNEDTTINIISNGQENEITLSNIFNICKIYSPNWQIIWRSSKINIYKGLKQLPWHDMEHITEDSSKKYKNIIKNQQYYSINNVANNIIGNMESENMINQFSNLGINNNELKDYEEDKIVAKLGAITISKKINRKVDRATRLKRIAAITGSKHLHYLEKSNRLTKDHFP